MLDEREHFDYKRICQSSLLIETPSCLLVYASAKHGLEAEEVFGIVVANVFYHLVHSLHFAGRYFAVFYIVTQEVAQCAAEIFMTWIGEE